MYQKLTSPGGIMEYELWLKEVNRHYNDYGYPHEIKDEECWREYYENGYHPDDAVVEDISCGI